MRVYSHIGTAAGTGPTLFARHLRRYIGAVPADRTIVRALLPLVIEAQPSAPTQVQNGWLDSL